MNNSALVILSGGQDSTTCLFWAKQKFDMVRAITFNYGQRHRIELKAANIVAQMAGVEHEIIDMKGILLSTSPLLSDEELDQYQDAQQMEQIVGDRVEKTFVPMRNALFLTIAVNRALAYKCDNIVIGVSEEDSANYPDCTNEFLDDFCQLAATALGPISRLILHAPLIDNTKKETVKLAYNMPECWNALAYTHTSYDGKYPPTDKNHANTLRAKGFEEAGLPDPLVLRAWREGLMELPETANYANIS